MKSILQMFKQGTGPHSTLNMVPYQACLDVAWSIHERKINVNHVRVHLYNEFARLEKQAGISSDIAAAFAISNYKVAVTADKQCPNALKKHPYAMDIEVYTSSTDIISRHRVVAVGGGDYKFIEGQVKKPGRELPFDSFNDVREWFVKHPDKSYVDFVCLADNRFDFLATLIKGYNLAEIALRRGLTKFGEIKLPDKEIHYLRRARSIWLHDRVFQSEAENANRILTAFAYALAEEICDKAIVVASPTLCTTSVLWAMVLFLERECGVDSLKLAEGLAAAGIFASLMESGASLGSIDVGCQGVMGTACGMAAIVAAVCLFDAPIDECGRAFEMALEHSLGIICSATTSTPIIPCIQRCAAFATRAYEIAHINHSLMSTPELCKVDDLIAVINDTGADLIEKNKRLGVGGFVEHAPYSLKKPTPKDWE